MEVFSMKTVFIVITLLLFATALMSCAANEKKLQESGAKLLNQQDLIEIFSIKRIASVTFKSGDAVIYYFPDGTQRVAWKGGIDEGKYRIENGQFCSKWKRIRKGKEKCYRVYRSGDNEFTWVKLDGSYDVTVTFKDLL